MKIDPRRHAGSKTKTLDEGEPIKLTFDVLKTEPAQSSVAPGNYIPARMRLKIRNLYLVKGLKPVEIAREMGEQPKRIHNIIQRNGWTVLRRENEEKAAREAAVNAAEAAKEYMESVTYRTEELAHRGLDLAEDAADKSDAKSFALAASGFKTFHDATRKGMGLDQVNVAINAMSFIVAEPIQRSTKNVTPNPERIQDSDTEEDIDLG